MPPIAMWRKVDAGMQPVAPQSQPCVQQSLAAPVQSVAQCAAAVEANRAEQAEICKWAEDCVRLRDSASVTSRCDSVCGFLSRAFGVGTGLRGSASYQTGQKVAIAEAQIQERVAALQQRRSRHVAKARQCMQIGQKPDALREIKKAKLCERQLAAAQCVGDAIEQQSDLLVQTGLQRTVAVALGATAKTMKRDKKLLIKAENAVDDAVEMRDLSEDLSQVMAGLGDGVHADLEDDDALMDELEQLAAIGTSASPTTHAEPRGAHRPVQVHTPGDKMRDETVVLPSVPFGAKGRFHVVEKQGLLA